MNYCIEYAVLCNKGIVRAKNQDNFWCMGKFLTSDNDGLKESIYGTVETKDAPAFAVFDGMGGELHGEVAAYTAASSFNNIYTNHSKSDMKAFLVDACSAMNHAICAFSETQFFGNTGSTAAILMFGKRDIYICNIGDTRIYHWSNAKLLQISHDHSENSITNRKPALTQNLGIRPSEFVIAPYIAKGVCENGDKYLICSDGLTDMISNEAIEEVLSSNNNVRTCAEILLQKALSAGGHDNTTIILCEIRKQKRGLNLLRRSK